MFTSLHRTNTNRIDKRIISSSISNQNRQSQSGFMWHKILDQREKAYIDVRVFNPLAKCYMNRNLAAAHKKNEAEKKRQYNQRVLQVEQGSLTPHIFS